MRTSSRFAIAALLVFAASASNAAAQMPGMRRMNMDSLRALTMADYESMKSRIGIKETRPGRNPNSDDPSRQPNYDEYTGNPYVIYPDALTTFSGKAVRNAKMWYRTRRPELVKVFEDEIYGRIPADVPGVSWKVVSEEKIDMDGIPAVCRQLAGVVDNSSYPAISVEIQAQIVWPENAPAVIPVVVEFGYAAGKPSAQGFGGGKSWQMQVIERGWAAATIVPSSIQADGGYGLTSGIIGLCNKGERRSPEDWGALRAWGWGASRFIDYLQTQKQFDAGKVAIEGVSRYGKAAAVAMAFDERIAAGFIASSGKAGVAGWRRDLGESIGNITSHEEYHWMSGSFIRYGADPLTENDIPVDQHELIALCAPRPCLISGGRIDADKWQDVFGMFMSAAMASPVYELLGAKGLGTDVFPVMDHGLMDGDLAFRQHHGGHEAGPNWPYFLDFFGRTVVNR